MYRTLLVEDYKDLSTITKANLSYAGYAVDAAFTCAQALEELDRNRYDLILLDMILPDMRGDELCRHIRSSCGCPIIFVSCLDDSRTIVSALRGGADDYMIKPIRYDELLARAEAVIRRSIHKPAADGSLLHFQHFQIDTVRRTACREADPVELSEIEYQLLLFLVQHPGELLLYQQIYEAVWGGDSLGDFRTVMVHISKLRKKIDPDHRGIIDTVRGAGYIFSDV